eukprot:61301-Rhodomonas_salina.2
MGKASRSLQGGGSVRVWSLRCPVLTSAALLSGSEGRAESCLAFRQFLGLPPPSQYPVGDIHLVDCMWLRLDLFMASAATRCRRERLKVQASTPKPQPQPLGHLPHNSTLEPLKACAGRVEAAARRAEVAEEQREETEVAPPLSCFAFARHASVLTCRTCDYQAALARLRKRVEVRECCLRPRWAMLSRRVARAGGGEEAEHDAREGGGGEGGGGRAAADRARHYPRCLAQGRRPQCWVSGWIVDLVSCIDALCSRCLCLCLCLCLCVSVLACVSALHVLICGGLWRFSAADLMLLCADRGCAEAG